MHEAAGYGIILPVTVVTKSHMPLEMPVNKTDWVWKRLRMINVTKMKKMMQLMWKELLTKKQEKIWQ